MEKGEIEGKVKQCFENLGILIQDGENFLLADYIVESLTYMSFLVELEQMFEMDIPDEYLMEGRLETWQDVCNMVETLLNQKASMGEPSVTL